MYDNRPMMMRDAKTFEIRFEDVTLVEDARLKIQHAALFMKDEWEKPVGADDFKISTLGLVMTISGNLRHLLTTLVLGKFLSHEKADKFLEELYERETPECVISSKTYELMRRMRDKQAAKERTATEVSIESNKRGGVGEDSSLAISPLKKG
jgi:hypothetical protein